MSIYCNILKVQKIIILVSICSRVIVICYRCTCGWYWTIHVWLIKQLLLVILLPDDAVLVQWYDSAHRGVFPLNWLKKNDYCSEKRRRDRGKHQEPLVTVRTSENTNSSRGVTFCVTFVPLGEHSREVFQRYCILRRRNLQVVTIAIV